MHAPALQYPPDSAAFGPYDEIQFRWTWDSELREREFFTVRLWQKGELPETYAFLKDTQIAVDLPEGSSGTFLWNIAVVRLTEDSTWIIVSDESETRSFDQLTGAFATPPVPTPPPEVMQPTLLEPEEGAKFNPTNKIHFKWIWYRDLEEQEYFALSVWHEGIPEEKHSLTWVKTKDYILDLRNPPIYDIDFSGGHYLWRVAVVVQIGPDPTHNPNDWLLIAESEPRRIQISN